MRSIDVKMIQFVVAVFSVTASDTAHDDHILTTMILETENSDAYNSAFTECVVLITISMYY